MSNTDGPEPPFVGDAKCLKNSDDGQRTTYLYLDPAGPLLDPELRFHEIQFEPRLFFFDREIWETASKLKMQVENPASSGYAEALRVCPRSSSTQTKLSEHEANRGEAEKSECVSIEVFEILGQPAAAIEPSESALDNPTSRQKRKSFGLVGAFDDFDLDVRQDFG